MKIWISLLVLAAAAGGWWFFQHNGTEEPQYQTTQVTQGDMTQVVTATGALNPVVNVTVGSQISGIISKLFADFNSSVTAGETVALIDPATYLAIVHQTEGDLANAKAALELAKITAQRKKDLVAQKAAPQADLDTAQATLHQAEATVTIKEANLEKAQADLDRCTIKSPINGTVISRSVDVGQTVAATMNAPVLFLIANDLTKMQIDSAVAEADVGTVENGQTVDFSVDAYPYRTFHGKVAQVRNAATTVQNVVTYDVVIAVDNPDLKLKPGMTANVSIVVATRENAVKVPNAALRFHPPEATPAASQTPSASSPATAGGGGQRPPGAGGGGPRPGGGRPRGPRAERKLYVLAPGSNKPEPVDAKLGISDGVSTEVVSGLKAGDVVVTGLINPQKAAAPAAPNPLGGGGFRPR